MINQGLSTAPCMSNFLTNNIKLMFDRLIAGDIHKTREMVNQIIPEDCVVCAGTNVNNFITKKGRVSYYECSECGAVMSNKAVDLQIDLENDARWKPLENDFYRKLQYDIADHIFEKISKKEFCVTKVLEIGPGNGHLAKRITSDKLVAYTGLDISDMACSYVREKCSDASVIIENKNFYQYTTEEKYHVIILDKSLECFGYPVEVLKKIKNMLHKNGMIVMVLHNTDNWKKFDNHWPAINTFLPGENAVLYNYRSIEIISTLYGFKIIEVEELNEADFMMVTLENNVESEG
jgi:2-polyprenyl-3-methyl-5-hydroxy-6-metoxy-1,4-benzoquinol methylase